MILQHRTCQKMRQDHQFFTLTLLLLQYRYVASVPGSLPYACAIFTYDLWTPRNEKSGREPGIFYHVSDVEGREKVERTRLRVGGQTRKQTVAHAFVQSPVTRRCTATYILLACRKAISISYSCLHRGLVKTRSISTIYAVHTYVVRGAYSSLNVYTYSTYDTGQYPPHYYPAAAQSPSL